MNYDELIDLPHYEPKYHARMPMVNRAAQFASFAALNGHKDAIEMTAACNEDTYNASNCLSDLDF